MTLQVLRELSPSNLQQLFFTSPVDQKSRSKSLNRRKCDSEINFIGNRNLKYILGAGFLARPVFRKICKLSKLQRQMGPFILCAYKMHRESKWQHEWDWDEHPNNKLHSITAMHWRSSIASYQVVITCDHPPNATNDHPSFSPHVSTVLYPIIFLTQINSLHNKCDHIGKLYVMYMIKNNLNGTF